VGQVHKPPHPAAVLGYVTTMLINPNSHALNGGPATAQLETEVLANRAAMFRMSAHMGQLTSSATMGNLEALWAAGESHPVKSIAYSAHRRCESARCASVC